MNQELKSAANYKLLLLTGGVVGFIDGFFGGMVAGVAFLKAFGTGILTLIVGVVAIILADRFYKLPGSSRKVAFVLSFGVGAVAFSAIKGLLLDSKIDIGNVIGSLIAGLVVGGVFFLIFRRSIEKESSKVGEG